MSQPIPIKPISVTVNDAVKASGLSRSTLYKALQSGDLTARKVGKRTLILFASLERFIADQPTYESEAA
jgi:excisionase family DNA binding protein